VKSGPGALVAVALTAGSDGATATLYDNTAASGTVLVTLKAAANGSAVFTPAAPYAFAKGCYADLTGTGPAVTVVYL
jgi:hypothetical protein